MMYDDLILFIFIFLLIFLVIYIGFVLLQSFNQFDNDSLDNDDDDDEDVILDDKSGFEFSIE